MQALDHALISRPVTENLGTAASAELLARYLDVRTRTTALAAPLSPEDCQVQSMPDASPVKWHLAHVTWFFETFVLERFEPDFEPFDPAYRVLFNSYYQAVGEQHPRAQRGLVSRPPLDGVLAWRAQVDARMARLLKKGSVSDEMTTLVVLAMLLPWSLGLLVVGPWLGHASWHAYRGSVRWLDENVKVIPTT